MENRIEDVEEIDTLIAELEISKGKGNLILCVVNSPLYRDRIIKALEWRFSSKVVNVKNGEQIIDILKRKEFDDAEILIWVMPEEPTEDLLNTLNNFRELFYGREISNVVFYNQAFSESIIKNAPDFWRYRGNYYEFKEIEGGLTFEALEALTTPLTFKDKEDLLRRKRINEYLLEKVRDKEEKSEILGELGLMLDYLGEFDEALEYHEKALKLYEELEIKEGIAIQFGNIGSVYRNKGEFDKALEYHEKALKLNEELNKKEGIATQLGDIGTCYSIKGEFDKAVKYYKKALKLNEELGRKNSIAAQIGNLGIVYGNKGELDKALEYYEKALEIFKEMGNKMEISRALMNIGEIFVLKGDKEKALDCYLEAQNLAKGSYIFKEINKELRKLKKKVATDIQKNTKVRSIS